MKSGERGVRAPVYSHTLYDIVPNEYLAVDQPDVLIVEGLNVLQTRALDPVNPPKVFVSDFFDFSIYVDADESHIQNWYIERFLTLRRTVFRDPSSYFRGYGDLDEDDAVREARMIWDAINGPNLHDNIEPTRERADLILTKGAEHSVERVALRRR